MKVAKLIHNPHSGDEKYGRKELINLITSNGFECIYTSDPEKLGKDGAEHPDFLIAAGGDGTVRKIVKEMLKGNGIDIQLPLALLPLGTANNIAKTLDIDGTPESIVPSWRQATIRNIDVGLIAEHSRFFIEGFGCGVIPELISRMDNRKDKEEITAEEELRMALKVLHDIVLSYEAKEAIIVTDSETFSGSFLMVEIMNIKYIGPNLMTASEADVSDGLFDVAMVTEEDRKAFASYVLDQLNGNIKNYPFRIVKSKDVSITWNDNHFHADDELIKTERQQTLKAFNQKGVLKVMI